MSDLISREEAVKRLKEKEPLSEYGEEYDTGMRVQWESDLAVINALAQRSDKANHACWFYLMDDDSVVYCSDCKKSIPSSKITYYIYCPYCGARMDKKILEEK